MSKSKPVSHTPFREALKQAVLCAVQVHYRDMPAHKVMDEVAQQVAEDYPIEDAAYGTLANHDRLKESNDELVKALEYSRKVLGVLEEAGFVRPETFNVINAALSSAPGANQ